MRLLLWPLGGFLIGNRISGKTFEFILDTGLFFFSTHNCMAQRISVGFDVLVDGESRQVKAEMLLGIENNISLVDKVS